LQRLSCFSEELEKEAANRKPKDAKADWSSEKGDKGLCRFLVDARRLMCG
jgi:hypothetical protein